MSEFPTWFLNESLMIRFLSSGGNDLERDVCFQKVLNNHSLHVTLADNKRLGYFSTASPLGAERGRWMIQSPELHYTPLVFQMQEDITVVDPDTFDQKHVHLRALSGDEFLEIALGKFIIYNWR